MIWSPEARADLRAIDRETAMQILHCVDRYLANRTGDVKKLKPPLTGFRLRCGDYRVFFDLRTRTPSTSPPSATAAKPTAERLRTALERCRTRGRTDTGQSPDAHRTRRAFSAVRFLAPEAQGMVSGRNPAPIFQSHFFDGWKQTERRGSRVKGARFGRVHRSERGDP